MPEACAVAENSFLDEDRPPLRDFVVPYEIKGEITIRATDAEGARYLAEHTPLSNLAMMGELEMFDPEEQEAVQ